MEFSSILIMDKKILFLINYNNTEIFTTIPLFYLEVYVKTLSTLFFYDSVQHAHAQNHQMFLNK
jgi:hypothetical protein